MSKENRKDSLFVLIDKQAKKIAKLLPPTIDVETWIIVAKTYIENASSEAKQKKKPSILDAEVNSIMSGVEKAAKDGLFLDGKESCLAVYSNNVGDKNNPIWVKIVNYQAMAKGLIKLARNSGQVKNLILNVVHKNDKFEYKIENGEEKLFHEPQEIHGSQAKGPKIGAYACVLMKDGTLTCCVMSIESINKIKNASKGTENSNYWANHPEEMEKKTVFRKLYKTLPSDACPRLPESVIKDIEADNHHAESDESTDNSDVIIGPASTPVPEIVIPEKKPTPKSEPKNVKGDLIKKAQIHIDKGDKDGLRKWYKSLTSEEKSNFTTDEIKKFIKDTELKAKEIKKAQAAKKPVSKFEEFLGDEDCPFDSEEILEDDPM